MSAARVLRALEVPALLAVPLVLAACAYLNLDQSALLLSLIHISEPTRP